MTNHRISIEPIPSRRAGRDRYRMTCTHCERRRAWDELVGTAPDFARYVLATYPDTAYRGAVVTITETN